MHPRGPCERAFEEELSPEASFCPVEAGAEGAERDATHEEGGPMAWRERMAKHRLAGRHSSLSTHRRIGRGRQRAWPGPSFRSPGARYGSAVGKGRTQTGGLFASRLSTSSMSLCSGVSPSGASTGPPGDGGSPTGRGLDRGAGPGPSVPVTFSGTKKRSVPLAPLRAPPAYRGPARGGIAIISSRLGTDRPCRPDVPVPLEGRSGPLQ